MNTAMQRYSMVVRMMLPMFVPPQAAVCLDTDGRNDGPDHVPQLLFEHFNVKLVSEDGQATGKHVDSHGTCMDVAIFQRLLRE